MSNMLSLLQAILFIEGTGFKKIKSPKQISTLTNINYVFVTNIGCFWADNNSLVSINTFSWDVFLKEKISAIFYLLYYQWFDPADNDGTFLGQVAIRRLRTDTNQLKETFYPG